MRLRAFAHASESPKVLHPPRKVGLGRSSSFHLCNGYEFSNLPPHLKPNHSSVNMIAETGSHAKAAKALNKKPDFPGWSTTDEQEIERRRLRASTENMSIQDMDVRGGFYGDFAVQSATGRCPYRVEIRSLLTLDNSCDCADFRNNGLGTCKHIEAVLSRLRDKGRKALAKAMADGSPSVEIYLSRKGNQEIRVLWPKHADPKIRNLIQPFFTSDGILLADPTESIPSLRRALDRASDEIRSSVRIGQDVEKWVGDLVRRKARNEAREAFLSDVKAERRSLGSGQSETLPLPAGRHASSGVQRARSSGR